MTDEEKKAIKTVEGLKVYYDDECLLDEEEIEENKLINNSVDTVLNLIQKQEKEIKFQKDINIMEHKRHKQTEKSLKGQIKKKDKIIEEMVDELTCDEFDNCCGNCNFECEKDYDQLSICIKQYFEREVERKNK
jgi:hypothetical protein